MSAAGAGPFSDFEQVWSRVTGAPEDAGAEDAAVLRELIADEARDRALYLALARRVRAASAALTELAGDEREHFTALQTEYYLLTGETCTPPESCPMIHGALSALRGAHAGELAGAERYMRAAESAGDAARGELFRAHAADERRHAETLRRLIMRAMS